MLGLDAPHRLGLQLDGVLFDAFDPSLLRAAHARLIAGPGAVNLVAAGDDVETTQGTAGEKGEAPNCEGEFTPFPSAAIMPLQSGATVHSRDGGSAGIVTVAADGSETYKSVQEAVDALKPEGGVIRIKPGTYRELVRVAKPHVRMEGLGNDPAQVVIVYGNSASITGSTFTSATVSITADDFSASGITFQNDFSATHQLQPQGSQAVALSVTGDQAVFQKVRILGAQDTLYAGGRSCQSEAGPCVLARQYSRDCYIEGHVDFIFGDSMAVLDHCAIHGIAHPEVLLTAQNKRYPEQASGLGRPWRSYSRVVFMQSELDAKVSSQGWREWHAGETERLKTATYAEYESSGPGAAPGSREPYSKQLTDAEATKNAPANFLAGQDRWNPTH